MAPEPLKVPGVDAVTQAAGDAVGATGTAVQTAAAAATSVAGEAKDVAVNVVQTVEDQITDIIKEIEDFDFDGAFKFFQQFVEKMWDKFESEFMKFLTDLLEKMWDQFWKKILDWIKNKLLSMYHTLIVLTCIVVGFALFYTFVWRLLVCGIIAFFGSALHRRKKNEKYRMLLQEQEVARQQRRGAKNQEKAMDRYSDKKRELRAFVQEHLGGQENAHRHLGHLWGWLPHWTQPLHHVKETLMHRWIRLWGLLKDPEWANSKINERQKVTWKKFGKPHDHADQLEPSEEIWGKEKGFY